MTIKVARPFPVYRSEYTLPTNNILTVINMKKTPNFDKDAYEYLKEEAKVLNTKYLTVNDIYTIAFRPYGTFPECRMVDVAVATCSPEDVFSKKVGKYQALLKMFDGACIQLPLMDLWRDWGVKEIKAVLFNMFAEA